MSSKGNVTRRVVGWAIAGFALSLTLFLVALPPWIANTPAEVRLMWAIHIVGAIGFGLGAGWLAARSQKRKPY